MKNLMNYMLVSFFIMLMYFSINITQAGADDLVGKIFQSGGYSYEIISDNEVSVYKYNHQDPGILEVLPNVEYQGKNYRVTQFYYDHSDVIVKKIIIPSGVKKVIINPDGVSDYKFPNLQEIILPDSLEYINPGFSFTMTNLKSIKLPDSNKHYKVVDNALFNKDGTDLIAFPSGDERTTYRIPSEVRTIKKEAFASNQNLKELSAADSVTELEPWTFSGSHIQTLDLTSVKNAGRGTFAFCHDLKEIKLGKETLLGKEQFYENSSLKNITVEEGNPKLWSENGILYGQSDDGKSLICYPSAKEEQSYAVPAGISRIDYSAFNMCRLEQVFLPASVKKIQGSAFNYGNEGRAENAIRIYLCSDSLPEMKKASFADLGSGSTVYLKNDALQEQFKNENQKYQYIDSQDQDAEISVSTMEQQSAEDIVLDKNSISIEMKTNGKAVTDLLGVSMVPPASTDKLVLSSSDPKVVKVTGRGEITAVSPGTASVIVQTGNVKKECRIIVYGPLGSVDPIPMQFYTGKEVRPKPTVRNANGDVLKPGTDYTVRYWNNLVSGTAKVLIDGTGCFRGSLEKEFDIRIRENDISRAEVMFSQKFYHYEGKPVVPGFTVDLNGRRLKEGRDYRTEYMANTGVGLGCICLTGIGSCYGQNFSYFQILKKEEPKNEKVPYGKKSKISSVSQPSGSVYTGKPVVRPVRVKSGARILKINRDYQVKYTSNKNCGRARMEISGKGGYTGKAVRYFMIVPKKAAIKKLRAGKKKIKVFAKKSPGKPSGYQICWAANKKFSKAKTRLVKNPSCLLKGLKSGRNYYVKVRAYKTTGGKKYFGAYSQRKRVKVR
ncbi:leucine-rich repeat protein [Anaerostipes sp.]|uniref:leucine-rich repeat protein n=1 Tax=Anaerostipes sp. TaxID=1872530 RepID=UPI0025C69602|nr:leucine-rich repeat protein [Anaerostipes sp.]MBS7006969.1 leucine-rich repeat protein [Anaerostipes sp.]